MTKTIDYFYAPTSPWTYLGGVRFEELAGRHGASVRHMPVDMAKVFSVSGGLPLSKRAPQRQAYRLAELARWRDHLGIPLTLQPRHFPAPMYPAAGMLIAARDGGLDCGRLANAMLRAVWVEERDLGDADTLIAVAGENGLDGKALLAEAESQRVKEAFEAATDEAIERSVFGAPTYIYKDQMFWGQDRLDFLDRALSRG